MRSDASDFRVLWLARGGSFAEKPFGCPGALVSKAVLTGAFEVYGTEEPRG